MKLKHFIIVGYLISTTITVVAIIWSVNTMLISKSDIYFIIGISILASITGALVSLLLLSRVFLSLDKLKQLIKGISDKNLKSWQMLLIICQETCKVPLLRWKKVRRKRV